MPPQWFAPNTGSQPSTQQVQYWVPPAQQTPQYWVPPASSGVQTQFAQPAPWWPQPWIAQQQWWGAPQDEWPVVPIWKFWRDDWFVSGIKLPPYTTKVDEQLFLRLLAGSISLSIDEKKQIISKFWQLSQMQVDELIKIFKEEKSKFASLDQKHAPHLRVLESKHAAEWDVFEGETVQSAQSQAEDVQAEEIRKKLGI